MPWRQAIRAICITLLTLCVLALIGSYFLFMVVVHDGNTHNWALSLGGGEITLGNDDMEGEGDWADFGEYDAGMRTADQKAYAAAPYHLLGFAWQPRSILTTGEFVMIPFWFPTTLSAGLLWLIWRKTRPKYNGKGFPVEFGYPQTNP